MKLTQAEAVAALYAAAEKKASNAGRDDLSLDGSAAGMAAQVQAPTSSLAEVRARRAENLRLMQEDPAGAAIKFGGTLGSLLESLGLG